MYQQDQQLTSCCEAHYHPHLHGAYSNCCQSQIRPSSCRLWLPGRCPCAGHGAPHPCSATRLGWMPGGTGWSLPPSLPASFCTVHHPHTCDTSPIDRCACCHLGVAQGSTRPLAGGLLAVGGQGLPAMQGQNVHALWAMTKLTTKLKHCITAMYCTYRMSEDSTRLGNYCQQPNCRRRLQTNMTHVNINHLLGPMLYSAAPTHCYQLN